MVAVTDREGVKTAVLRVFNDTSEVAARLLNAPAIAAIVFGEDEYENGPLDAAIVMEGVVESVVSDLVAGGTLAEVKALGVPAFVLAEHAAPGVVTRAVVVENPPFDEPLDD